MTDAPEKIWAHPRASEPLIEYTRSDIAQARIDELEAMVENMTAHIRIDDDE